MDKTKQRYNAKARGSSHKKKAKRKAGGASTEQPSLSTQDSYINPNAEIIQPKSVEQKEEERREKLRQEMLESLDTKANSKKKKRLEKYIDKKLKQEKRVVLFDKLSKSQATLDAALQLQSSATLGTGKPATHKEILESQEDMNVRRAMERVAKKRKGTVTFAADSRDEAEDEGFGMEVDGEEPQQPVKTAEGKTKSDPIVVVDSGFSTAPEIAVQTSVAPSLVGSALRHNPDGSVVAPRIAKRKPKSTKTAFSSWKDHGLAQRVGQEDAAESDSSFDSSDSAYDEDEAEDDEESGEEGGDDSDASSWGGIQSDAGSQHSSEKEEESEPEEDSSVDQPPPSIKRKRVGFKDWALKQLSAAKGYIAPPASEDPPATEDIFPPPLPKKQKTEPSGSREKRGPLGEDLQLPQSTLAQQLQRPADNAPKPRKFVNVDRPVDVQESRLLLPVVAEEQPIMEAIMLNTVVIICGETGSGKTTQVPQFLFEAGFGSVESDNSGMIGITQPRRVAAVSMANRVAHELGLNSSRVSYQIRYDASVSPSTSIKFMTDGVLLRELATDFLLKKYSVIIIDEAHERSMNTDILIGVLSRVIKLREEMWKEHKGDVKPLRLIIMSATLRISDFAENTTLFASPPPIINVAARQHPVTVHFSRRTASDYVTEAIKKASKIHVRLPPGGILIFLTGQNEITGVCRKLEARYGKRALDERRKMRQAVQERLNMRREDEEGKGAQIVPSHADVEAEDLDLGNTQNDLAFDIAGDAGDAAADEEALDSDDEDGIDNELGIDAEETDVPIHIVPLYALLSSEKQMQVFQPPPPGTRLVVVSTNIAETSLTIPGIRYVVDCGRAKERRYDVANGVQAFQVSWISKASAAQRAGRAGRTGPGHCYRLYSSALYENYFEQSTQPEILRVPIEGVVLQMKSMHIDAVVNFPFPTPPDRLSLRKAETILTHLGALKSSSPSRVLGGEITEIGRAMALFPLSPRYSRMLVSGRQHGCLPFVITVVSALSVGDPFLREEAVGEDAEESDQELDETAAHLTSEKLRAAEARKIRRRAFFRSQHMHASLGDFTSDIFRLLSVVGAYEYAGGGHGFCADHFVRPKAMEEIHKLRAQISNIAQANFPELQTGFVPNLKPPSSLQLKVLRQLITAGFIDQVAVRKDIIEPTTASGAKYTTSKGIAYCAMGVSEAVYIHPSSVLYNTPPPDYVVYLEVVRTSRVWIQGITSVNPAWLSTLGKSLCTSSKSLTTKDGQTVVIPHFGPGGWELPPIKRES